MRFQVLLDDKPRTVQLEFGGLQDLRTISHWRVPALVSHRSSVRDTIEFARFAAKRHRHYMRSAPSASSVSEFKSITSANPQAEIAILLVVRANWFRRSRVLGLAQCRRTYCNHLVLEFLSVHPAIVGRIEPRIMGVGTGLLYGLIEVAAQLDVKLIWGEATANSAPFYAQILQQPSIADHFFIRGETFDQCRRSFRDKVQGQLD